MKSPLSACDIEVLLHCYVHGTRHRDYVTTAVRSALRMWVRSGMLTRNTAVCQVGAYSVTQKGMAMVEALKSTPEPKRSNVWADARTGKALI